MTNRPKKIGTEAETASVRAIKPYFPLVERKQLCGENDCGDLTGTPRLCWQVKGGKAAKAASDNQVLKWMEATEKQRCNLGAELGILILQRAGIGAPNAHMWWAIITVATMARLTGGDPNRLPNPNAPVRLHLGDLCGLLVAAGYGTPVAAAA
jgi:hypothetical protein